LETLEEELERSEDAVRPAPKTSARKGIVWAKPAVRERTPLALVYLHGFSASRPEISPVCERLGERLGANVFFARLRGHGQGADALGAATAEDWMSDVEEAVSVGRRIGERVILVGTSTGATLAVLWCAHHPAEPGVSGLILVSPNFAPRDSRSRILLWPWGPQMVRAIVGPDGVWQAQNAGQAEHWTTRYTVGAVTEMMTVCRAAEEANLSAITRPVLIFGDPRDQVVDYALVDSRFQEFGSRNKTFVRVRTDGDLAYHVLAGDILSPKHTAAVIRRMQAFVESLDTVVPSQGSQPPVHD